MKLIPRNFIEHQEYFTDEEGITYRRIINKVDGKVSDVFWERCDDECIWVRVDDMFLSLEKLFSELITI